MSNETPNTDPLEFMKGMWGSMGFSLPGMVAPTFDTDELEKRIGDLKAVEGWLRMNLSMLQMTIQGLEMQHSTLSAVQAMSRMATEGQAGEGQATGGESFAQAAMWPWHMMQQMQSHMQQPAAPEAPADEAPQPAKTAAPRKTKKQ
ncbi:MAG: hypothetical protein H3C26_06620 [Rhodocyclaceae bacterium]|nr:hypothetical protein [Rhodocyclaceae bacterium]